MEDYTNISSLNRKLIRKESRPKYKRTKCRNENCCSQHGKVIKRFNKLVKIIKINRDTIQRKELEMKIKSKYIEVCVKSNQSNDGGGDSLNISEESDDENLEVYAGFAGESILGNNWYADIV